MGFMDFRGFQRRFVVTMKWCLQYEYFEIENVYECYPNLEHDVGGVAFRLKFSFFSPLFSFWAKANDSNSAGSSECKALVQDPGKS